MTLGKKLQELRKKESLSQERFAEMMQVSRQAVSKWELDQSLPELDKLVDISNYYDVSMDFLVKEKMDELVPNNEESTVLDQEQYPDNLPLDQEFYDGQEDMELDHTIKKRSFDILHMFMLVDLAIFMTALRFFITNSYKTGFVIAGFGTIVGIIILLIRRFL